MQTVSRLQERDPRRIPTLSIVDGSPGSSVSVKVETRYIFKHGKHGCYDRTLFFKHKFQFAFSQRRRRY